MGCPIKLVVRECDKCPFGKEGLCDFPYARGVRTQRRSYDVAVAILDFKRRFEEMRDDIASGRLTFRNHPQEWTEEMLDMAALRCTLCKIYRVAGWN
jgi:hypothetical protein